jgi:hypothetical protein
VMNLQDFAAEHLLQDYCRLEECFASSIWAVRASTCASVGGISLDLIDRWMSYEVTANTSSLQTQKKHNWVGRYTLLFLPKSPNPSFFFLRVWRLEIDCRCFDTSKTYGDAGHTWKSPNNRRCETSKQFSRENFLLRIDR